MDKKRNFELAERLLQKHLVPQLPKGLPLSYGERIAFKAGMDAAEELYRPLLEAVEKIALETPENSNFSRSEDEAQYYIDTAREALAKLREAGE